MNLDTTLANALSQLEVNNKHYIRPNSYLHKWWARRCGSTFRLILKGLVKDDARRDYYAPGGLEGMIILDPMMGGGTTLHEAIRMGANVVGMDVDPIPVFQARSALADIPLPEIEEAFSQFLGKVQADVSPWFVTDCPYCQTSSEIRYTLYGVRQRCGCREIIKVDNFLIQSRRHGNNLVLCSCCHTVHGEDDACATAVVYGLPLVDRTFSVCPDCGQKPQESGRPFCDRYEPVMIMAQCPTHGPVYRRPDGQDLALIRQAAQLRDHLPLMVERCLFHVMDQKKSGTLRSRGITNYQDVLSGRQAIYMDSAIRHLADVPGHVRLPLALLVSTSLEFNTMLCGYKGERGGAVRHVFSRHGYTIPYTALENNPVMMGRASGSLPHLFHQRIRRASLWAASPVEPPPPPRTGRVAIPGEVGKGIEVNSYADLQHGRQRYMLLHQSAVQIPLPDNSVDHVVTDPPYYNSVQYSDLAAFFHPWLSLLYPHDAWRGEYVKQSAAITTGQGWRDFATVMGQIFAECHRVLKPDGYLVFTFHHWQSETWAALTIALRYAGFCLVEHHIVLSENPLNCHVNGMKALLHDGVLVLKKKEEMNGRIYPPVTRLNQHDSATFCDGCCRVLGWLLGKDVLPDQDVLALWQCLVN